MMREVILRTKYHFGEDLYILGIGSFFVGFMEPENFAKHIEQELELLAENHPHLVPSLETPMQQAERILKEDGEAK